MAEPMAQSVLGVSIFQEATLRGQARAGHGSSIWLNWVATEGWGLSPDQEKAGALKKSGGIPMGPSGVQAPVQGALECHGSPFRGQTALGPVLGGRVVLRECISEGW